MRLLTGSSNAVAAAVLFCFLSQPACNNSEGSGPTAREPLAQNAQELVRAVQAKFLSAAPSLDGKGTQTLSQLGPSIARGFDRTAENLLPHFGALSTKRPVAVELPNKANGSFRLTDTISDLSIEVGLEGTQAAQAETVNGYVVYRNAVDTGHLLQRPQPEGTEDYVLHEVAPATPELRYAVTLTRGVAGLRLVSETLEFLDATGVPRLRMAPPFLRDARGQVQMASVAVEGCDVDRSPVPPWGRATVDPQAKTCRVVIRWGSAAGLADVVYPALVDPAWTSTGNMTVKRFYHTATLLSDGRVLVVGGKADNTIVHQNAELYSPLSGTFASTAKPVGTRYYHVACVLQDGKVMISGGLTSSGTAQGTVEAFDPTSASWTSLAVMKGARANHTLTPLPSGEVLAAGGESGAALNSAELYNAVNNNWTITQNMQQARKFHTATLLENGKVLVTGGDNGNSLNSAELYFRTSESWTLTPTMATQRANHTATALDSGKVLVAGGTAGTAPVVGAQLYDTNSNTWSGAPDLTAGRRFHAASRLLNGRVILSGGFGTAYLASSEMFDPGNPGWTPGGDLKTARLSHTSTTLTNGKVLVTGGLGSAGGLLSAELFELQANGLPCQAPNECTTGWCVDGVCCDSVCTSKCMACTAAIKGQGKDGECGAIANNTDPENECEVLGTGTCATTGSCDGNGACGTQAGMQCEASLCLDETTQQNASTCDVDGACVPQGVGDCKPYLCLNNGCLKTCTSHSDCIATSACIQNVCVPPKSNGAPCGINADCTSAHCVEQVCCDDVCNGTCQSCREASKGTGIDGECGPAKVGLACGSTTCINGIQSGLQCTATSTCEMASIPCSPYLCADSDVCAVECTTDAQCKSGNYCDKTNKCLAKGNLGAMCKEGKECLSTQCVDWVCCDNACGGSITNDCLGCSLAVGATEEGKCTPLDNTPCQANGVCSAGVCMAVKDAGQDTVIADVISPDVPPDTVSEPPPTTDVVPADTKPSDAVFDTKKDGTTSSEGGDAATEASTDAAGVAGSPGAPPAEDEGGCGCRMQSTPPSTAGWLALGGLALLLSRRRRRSQA